MKKTKIKPWMVVLVVILATSAIVVAFPVVVRLVLDALGR